MNQVNSYGLHRPQPWRHHYQTGEALSILSEAAQKDHVISDLTVYSGFGYRLRDRKVPAHRGQYLTHS